MAGEVKFIGPGTGATCYFTIRGSGQAVWSTSGGTGGWESYTAADYTDYGISATEQGATNVYIGSIPSAVPPGAYDILAQRQLTGSPLPGDPAVGEGTVQWGGTAVVPLSNLATSGQVAGFAPIRIARGTMVLNFPIYLVSAVDHVTPVTSGALTLSGQVSKDGAAFTALQSGSFTEVGLGTYTVNLTSGDLLCNTATLWFKSASSDPRVISLVTQRTSGQS